MELHDLLNSVARGARSTPELVAAVLREAILQGRLRDGQALRQDELAQQLGVSKIPLREALRRLEAEGLVCFFPNRGAVVATLAAAEAEEIAEMRAALETLALRHAIPALAERDLRRAAALLDEIDEERDTARWSGLNWAFHDCLYAPAGRPRLLETIRGLHTAVDRYMRVVLVAMQHQDQSQREHRDLLAACARRDLPAAEQILSTHIETAGRMLVEHLVRKV